MHFVKAETLGKLVNRYAFRELHVTTGHIYYSLNL